MDLPDDKQKEVQQDFQGQSSKQALRKPPYLHHRQIQSLEWSKVRPAASGCKEDLKGSPTSATSFDDHDCLTHCHGNLRAMNSCNCIHDPSRICLQEAINPRLNWCLGSTERGAWRGVGRKGWQRVGERLAKGWRRVGEGLAKGWRVSLPSNFAIPGAAV